MLRLLWAGSAVKDYTIEPTGSGDSFQFTVYEWGVYERSSVLAGQQKKCYIKGFATTAARAGKPDRAIQKQTRHKSAAMLAEYVREGRLFDENASEGIGL